MLSYLEVNYIFDLNFIYLICLIRLSLYSSYLPYFPSIHLRWLSQSYNICMISLIWRTHALPILSVAQLALTSSTHKLPTLCTLLYFHFPNQHWRCRYDHSVHLPGTQNPFLSTYCCYLTLYGIQFQYLPGAFLMLTNLIYLTINPLFTWFFSRSLTSYWNNFDWQMPNFLLPDNHLTIVSVIHFFYFVLASLILDSFCLHNAHLPYLIITWRSLIGLGLACIT